VNKTIKLKKVFKKFRRHNSEIFIKKEGSKSDFDYDA